MSFGLARPLYERREHPRLLLDGGELCALSHAVREEENARRLMAALRQKTAILTRLYHESTDRRALLLGDGTHHSPGARIGYALNDLALVAAIDRDEAALEVLRGAFRLFGGEPEAKKSRACGSLAGLAFAYDLLGAELGSADAFLENAAREVARLGAPARPYLRFAGGNIGLIETLSAIPLALAIEGETPAPLEEPLAWLIRYYEAAVYVAIGENGYPTEDIGYGTAVAGKLGLWGEMLWRSGRFDPYATRLSRAGRAILHFVEPWGEDLVNTGDHGNDFRGREFLLARLAQRTGDAALLWLLGTLSYHHGKVLPENTLPDYYVEVPLAGAAPAQAPATAESLLALRWMREPQTPAQAQVPTAFCDRSRGIVSLRSGWGADDLLVVFDASQRNAAASGHHHASAGHFILSALGEHFAVGPGRYQMEQDQHSVVLVEGRSGRSTEGQWRQMDHAGLLLEATPGEWVDCAAADSSLQHDCLWARRTLGLVKGEMPYLWMVDDLNVRHARTAYQWQLQSCPENTIALETPESACITGWRHGNRLAVHFVLPGGYGQPPTLALSAGEHGSGSPGYLKNLEALLASYSRPAQMRHGPVLRRPRLVAGIESDEGRWLTLMLPVRQGAAAPEVTALPTLPGAVAARIRHPLWDDFLVFAFEHGLLEAGPVKTRGRWALERRCRRSGALLRSVRQESPGAALRNGENLCPTPGSGV